ncbi:MAG: hypothetical protein ACFBWO_11340 [Paracoccaceae bacterium]
MDTDARLLAYLQGRLDAEDAARLEAELAESPDLRAELAAMRAARDAMARERPEPAAGEAGWDRLSAAIEAERRLPANDNRRFSLAQVAAIAAAAVIVVQIATLALPIGDEAGFVPASETTEATAGPALRVAFAEEAGVGAVTALLGEIGAEVTGGPSAIGLYTLSFADEAAREAAEARLAERPALVAMVSRP